MGRPAFKLPSVDDMQAARAAVTALDHHGVRDAKRVRLTVDESDEPVEVSLPAQSVAVLMRVLDHMAQGHAVAVLPVEAELTTQQAADVLGMSRPFLVKLLDEGRIRHHKVGTHRRVKVADLIEFQKADHAERQRIADELTAEAQRLGLGY